MREPLRAAVAMLLTAALGSGCSSATSTYEPRFVARGELTLRYDDGVQIYAGKKFLADSPEYTGLAHYVRCVPRAAEHAESAESDGAAAIGTGVAGTIIGISGLGGLAGLAYLGSDDESDKVKMYALLGSGVVVGLLGMTLALVSRGLKNSANGHAVDAMNYYNDAVGYYGGTCDRKRPKKRVILVPRADQRVDGPPVAPPPSPEALPEPPAPDPSAAPDTNAAPDPDQPSPDPTSPVPKSPAPKPDANDRVRDIDDVVDPTQQRH